MQPTLVISWLLLSIIMATTEGLEDGDLYKIIHSKSGQVLTVDSSGPADGASLKLSTWRNEPKQKWLAVQAVVAGNNYLLMPQQQRWDWNRFLRAGEDLRETKQRHDSLFDWTLVMHGDSVGQVAVQPRDSKKEQQWRSEKVSSNSGSSRVIIKNLKSNKCLEVPAYAGQRSNDGSGTSRSTSVSFFTRVRNWFGGLFGGGSSQSTTTTTTTTTPSPITNNTSNQDIKIRLSSCGKTSAGQQWTLETVPIRN